MQHVSTRQHWIDTPQGRLFAQSWDAEATHAVPIILLHDSLGCVTLWRDFPERLAQATGRQVIAYDRLGFGRSAAYPGLLPPSFVEDEAKGSFQTVCEYFDVNRFVVLGHSVGGGMAIGCAAAFAQRCQGVVTIAAQAFVETATRDGIREAERQFALPDQMQRLQKYHGDKADWVLRAWVDNWCSEAFGDWNLDAQLRQVRCPVLTLHGERDEYGSIGQPQRIAAQISTEVSVQILPDCGHVPHREYPDAVLASIGDFLKRL
ncbi:MULTISPECIES: alpha/beta fold hydrolase [Pseudomonas]|uniref:alpha/beta fold hydrolase n=1 Tax=Pseudomonas TaxID=286 RepID=UPI000A1F07AA|nr:MULTISPECIES: alpha/beta hydrolase [Pseudomonas]UDI91121.1 alpha/beta hydrolase [Pseudomonas sp. IAC-BECa141]UIN54693.1 alpha/beta hydrolase [Pseudomonas kribbensis]